MLGVLAIVLAMMFILAISVVLIAYVAYPHRGEELPYAPRFGEALRKRVEALPTLEDLRGR